MLRFMLCFIALSLLPACAQLGIKSLIVPTYSPVHDRAALKLLREAPTVGETFGTGLTAKDMYADGRLVGLSVSGGGARATAFTLGVLTELQIVKTSDRSNALDRIDFISSNSGGSWGVAAYLLDRSASQEPNYKLAKRVPEWMMPTFIEMSEGRVPCWHGAMGKHLGDRTFAQVYSAEKGGELPRVYFNAALLPAHAPFVFHDNFIRHYKVAQFGGCRNHRLNPELELAGLPLSYAAATSGTVPGFYYAYAETGLCAEDDPTAAPSFCHGKKRKQRSFLRLADGGLYDNMGYKTAFEVMRSQEARFDGTKRAMILIDSNESTRFKTVSERQRNNSFLLTTGTIGWLAGQDSTFERLYKPMFESLGVKEPVLLDFHSTAGFRADQVDLLKGLDELAFFAAHEVDCFVGDRLLRSEGGKLPVPAPTPAASVQVLIEKGGDCLSENFYRSGTLNKTTFRAKKKWFTILWQLGQLSVRMKHDKIVDELD